MNFVKLAKEVRGKNVAIFLRDQEYLKPLREMYTKELHCHLLIDDTTGELVVPVDWSLKVDDMEAFGGVSLIFKVDCLSIGDPKLEDGEEVSVRYIGAMKYAFTITDRMLFEMRGEIDIVEEFTKLVSEAFKEYRHPKDKYFGPLLLATFEPKGITKVIIKEKEKGNEKWT